MHRHIPFLLALFLTGCGKPTLTPASPEDVNLARAFLNNLESDTAIAEFRWEAIKNKIAEEHVDAEGLLRGAIKLLVAGEPKERRQATRLLGRLGDRRAVEPLVDILDDSDQELREEACYSLQWLHARGKLPEAALIRLRASDSSVDVRVAAALALDRPTDEDAIAAFKLGIELGSNDWAREICENQLEKMGMLELPLPEKIYTEISPAFYATIISHPDWFTVRRQCRKGDFLYFEAVERGVETPDRPWWYRVKID
jgi:hypothetical protein